MSEDVRIRLVGELKNIWDDRDFVNGVMTNAGSEELWGKILDYILMSKRRGEPATSDEILYLSLKLGGMQ